MNKFKNRFVIFLSTVLLLCLIQNNLFALDRTGYENITKIFKKIEDKALNGNEDVALEELSFIINTKAEEFQKKGVSTENIFVLKLMAFKMRGLIRLYNQGFYNEAIKDFNIGLTLDGKISKTQNPWAHIFKYHRSFAFYQAGNYMKAINDITECINEFDENRSLRGAVQKLSNFYSSRGRYYSANKQSRKALDDFKKAIELGNISNRTFLGYAYELDNTKNYKTAAFFFQKVSLSPSEIKSAIKQIDNPIALKTKSFISNKILSASRYIQIPEDLVTRALMYSKAYSSESNRQLYVERIQKLLKKIGYDPGLIDGIMGKQTRAAICNYQKDFNIPVDGQATEELYKNLRITRKAIEKQTTVSSNVKSNIPKVIKEVMPAVVTVKVYDEDNSLVSVGSGFFVKKSAIVTNLHVIGTSPYIKIKTYDGKYYGVTKILKDQTHDLALILLDKNCSSKNILKINKNLPEIGQNIIAIGNPLGMEQTVSDGIVSSIRRFEGNSVLIQISAPISPGSSGGPILNHKGEVIGIATLTFKEGQNINLAVSGKHVYELLKNNL